MLQGALDAAMHRISQGAHRKEAPIGVEQFHGMGDWMRFIVAL